MIRSFRNSIRSRDEFDSFNEIATAAYLDRERIRRRSAEVSRARVDSQDFSEFQEDVRVFSTKLHHVKFRLH